jgi:hypothetical protein
MTHSIENVIATLFIYNFADILHELKVDDGENRLGHW